MTEKELKKQLQAVYQCTPRKDKHRFLSNFKERDLNLWVICKQQLRYMSLWNYVISFVTFGIFLLGLWYLNKHQITILSALMPIVALFSITELSKSEHYGMDELEMASRFSLRMITIARIVVTGTINIILFLFLVPIIRIGTGGMLVQVIIVLGCPYLLSAWVCLAIIRRWHSKETLYLCAEAAIGVSFLQLLSEMTKLPINLVKSETWGVVIFLCLILLTGKELYKLLKEKEEISWNLS